jgi:uncharacterized protein (TIGR02246 family)
MVSRLAFVAVFCVFATGQAIAQSAQSDRHVFAEAFNRGDMAALANMYSDDAYLLPPQPGLVRGRRDIQQFWKSAGEQMKDLKLTTQNVKNLGPDTVREIGTYSAKTDQKEITGKYVIILEKAGNAWKIITDMWNTDK